MRPSGRRLGFGFCFGFGQNRNRRRRGGKVGISLYSFAGAGDACEPSWGPVIGAGGVLYGSTSQGGAYGARTFYELRPPALPGGTWAESVLYNFGAAGINFGAPTTNLVARSDGSFCFLAAGGVNGFGALVQMQPSAEAGAPWIGHGHLQLH